MQKFKKKCYNAFISKEQVKERLAELRFWRGVIVGAIVAIVGWFITNYKTADNVILCVIISAFIISLVVLVAVSFGIDDKIKEL